MDVDDDPALLDRYAEEIPVTLVDGRQHDFWRVDPDRLRAALGAAEARPAPRSGWGYSHVLAAVVRQVCSPVHKLLQ